MHHPIAVLLLTIGGWSVLVGGVLVFIDAGPLSIRIALIAVGAALVIGSWLLENHLQRSDD